MNKNCEDCGDQRRCLNWNIMETFPWVRAVSFDAHSGVLTVEHEYPEGIDIGRLLRGLFRERKFAGPVELRLVRKDPKPRREGGSLCNSLQ